VRAHGFDLGVEGTGILDMTGGEVLGANGGNGTLTYVGRGYTSNDVHTPGVGLVNQTGGVHRAGGVRIGHVQGSVGTYTVRDGATLTAATQLTVGQRGTGAVVQTGGLVEAKTIWLGREAGGFGQYTFGGGQLHQTGKGASDGLRNGGAGTGHLVVTGVASPILVEGLYRQGPGSRWTVVVDDEGLHTSPLVVVGPTIFDAAAVLDLDLVDNDLPSESDWQPEDGTLVYLLLTSDLQDHGLVLDPEDEADWKVEILDDVPFFGGTTVDAMRARYCPGHAQHPSCAEA